ncbi:hypothetical protein [Streptomyces malaysiensis]|uniref:Nucleotidyltransferase family protein n=1 Tax=Streptomyces autolyticus TaxID=75293 RepID=A0ABN4W060_9ACTN|nr:hypothetical protein [Streptomyces autolyticus]AQA10424.1 hypothetical protein BV401_07925 [Streptomyces autolyticus]MCC4319685.1 hypothetical protein [Streptomyces malaysiensis]
MALRDHPFFRELLSLRLPVEDYVVAGSAPMLAHGLDREIGDIDVVARGAAWKTALEMGHATKSPLGPAQCVALFGGNIEVLDGWFDYSVDSLIGEGEVIEGIRFLSLSRTVEWKSSLGRAVDLEDIFLIRGFLNGVSSS